MAVANVVGSNVFNLLMILGVVGLARRPLVFRRRTLTRGAGALLLLAYPGYVAWLAWNRR